MSDRIFTVRERTDRNGLIMPITLIDDAVVFLFPDVHPDAVLAVDFQGALRVPDDGTTYGLPPGA